MKKLLFLLFVICSFVAYPQAGVTTSGSLNIGGVTRTYTYYIPPTYDGSTAVPLVFNLHGLSGSSEKQEEYQDFRTIADTANFIIVHPEGEGFLFNTLIGWGTFVAAYASFDAGKSDREFIMTLLDSMESKYNINSNKVYSTGFSQGGFLSYHLAGLYNDRFAAVSGVSSSVAFEYNDNFSYSHPTPILHIHGTNDGTVSYNGTANTFQVDSLVQYFVCLNNCNTTPTIDTLADVDNTDNCYPIHYTYTGGDDGSTVEFYKVVNGGHQVPSKAIVSTANDYGLGDKNKDFSAAEVIWNFFRKYSLDQYSIVPTICEKSTVGIEESRLSLNISIYPNPSAGSFVIDLENYSGAQFTVFNVLGEIVFSMNLLEQKSAINLENASTGIYIYQLTTQDGEVAKGKIVIE